MIPTDGTKKKQKKPVKKSKKNDSESESEDGDGSNSSEGSDGKQGFILHSLQIPFLIYFFR